MCRTGFVDVWVSEFRRVLPGVARQSMVLAKAKRPCQWQCNLNAAFQSRLCVRVFGKFIIGGEHAGGQLPPGKNVPLVSQIGVEFAYYKISGAR